MDQSIIRRHPVATAVFFLVLVNVLWGLSFPTAKGLNLLCDRQCDGIIDIQSSAFRVATAGWIVGCRFGLGFLLLCLFKWSLVRRTSVREWTAGGLIGSFFVIGLILQTIGLAMIPASRSGFLTSLAVVFTPLFSAILHRKLPSRWVLISIVFSLFGVAILLGMLHLNQHGLRVAENAFSKWTIGDSLTTIATCFFACQILCIDRFARKMSPECFTPGMFVVVSAVGFGLLWTIAFGLQNMKLVSSIASLSIQPSFASMILILAFFPSLLAFSWMNTYQPSVTASQAAIIYTLEPLFVSAWAMVLPSLYYQFFGLPMENESLTQPILIGGGLILIANFFALRSASRP